jgi:DNA (cytosine-5)-methyltransferase 1
MELIAPTRYASAQHRKITNLNELHLFAGAGGGILGGMLLGHITVCAVEIEEYPRRVLLQRQRDGILPRFPIWDDVQTFDGKPGRGKVDVVCGGFPCQDLSIANPKGKGIDGERSGLWSEMARVISEIRPRFAFVENSPQLVGRGLARVTSDLANLGYASRWAVMGGHSTGSAANGERVWVLANAGDCLGWEKASVPDKITNSEKSWRRQFERAISACASEEADAEMRGNPNALARSMDRLKAAGNGQDPILAATAFKILSA